MRAKINLAEVKKDCKILDTSITCMFDEYGNSFELLSKYGSEMILDNILNETDYINLVYSTKDDDYNPFNIDWDKYDYVFPIYNGFTEYPLDFVSFKTNWLIFLD